MLSITTREPAHSTYLCEAVCVPANISGYFLHNVTYLSAWYFNRMFNCTWKQPEFTQRSGAPEYALQGTHVICCCINIFLVCFALSRIMMFDGIIFSDDCRSSIFTVVPPVAMHGHIRRVN
jgi:hypothetical protein